MERGPHRNWEVNDERNICREYSSLPSNWNHSHELAVSHTLMPLIFSLLLCAKFLLRGEEIHKIRIENIYDSEHTGVDRISRVLSNRSNFEQSYTRINWILSNRSNSLSNRTRNSMGFWTNAISNFEQSTGFRAIKLRMIECKNQSNF